MYENIGIDVTEIGFGVVEWIKLAQDRILWLVRVGTVINLEVPQKAGDFLTD